MRIQIVRQKMRKLKNMQLVYAGWQHLGSDEVRDLDEVLDQMNLSLLRQGEGRIERHRPRESDQRKIIILLIPVNLAVT